MGIYDAAAFVPKLDVTGSNFYQWNSSMKVYATIHDATEVLEGTKTVPEPPSYAGLIPEPSPLDISDIDPANAAHVDVLAKRRGFDDSRRSINTNIEKAAEKQVERIKYWKKLDGVLQMTLIQTLPRNVFEAVQGLGSAAAMYAEIVRRYQDEGLNEACSAWSNFFKLRCSTCPTTQNFTDKFRAALNKLKDLKLILPEQGIVYQFILAIEDTYPDEARDIRRDLRQSKGVTLDLLIHELNDEARRNDPVKAAAFAAKNNTDKTGDIQRGGGHGRGRGGHGRGGRGGNRGGSSHGADSKTTTPPAAAQSGGRPGVTMCLHCSREHYGAGDRCWVKFPHLKVEHETRKAAQAQAAAAPSVTQTTPEPAQQSFGQYNAYSFATVDDSNVAEVSEQAMQVAHRTEYKDRTIVDTGATDHICNDLSKFVEWKKTPTRSGIKTGAGVVAVLGTGSITLNLLCVDGTINHVTFNNVLYAPDMFVSIISHSQIRDKGLYYHGWEEKLLRHSDGLELAYTPEIDGIPNILQASNELEAAQAFAFVLANSPRPKSAIQPTRKITLCDLHETFGHANVESLKKLVATTTGLELSSRDNFSCEVCLLGNSQKQISRVSPNRATYAFQRVHVDIVGPMANSGDRNERYWVIYTDDYTRFRWIDTVESKSDCTTSLLRFLRMIKTQHRVNVAIVHLDNDNVLINHKTKAELSSAGTVFEPSTPYTAHQNGVAESSNRIYEARVRLMQIGAPHVPKNLWPFTARYAAELINHYPTTAVPGGKTPRQLLMEYMGTPNPVPNLHSIRKYGELGFVHIPEQRRVQGDKFSARAIKAYFVGREGSRIYLMWDPISNKVIRTSSVKFANAPLHPIVAQDDAEYPAQGPADLSSQLSRPSIDTPPSSPLSSPPSSPSSSPALTTTLGSELSSQVPSGGEDEATLLQELEDIELPELGQGHRFEGFPMNPDEAPRHLDISSTLDNRLIIDTKRSRRPTLKAAAVSILYNLTPNVLARCFASAIAEAPSIYNSTSADLPPEPTSHKQAMQHVFATGWMTAEGEEYQAHEDNGTWSPSVSRPEGTFALPTKWVYKYKFDETGKLIRLKARLVVCGNRQNSEFWRETYAAVARSTTLKVVLALVAALNLECDAADVVTAFLNGRLDDDEHIWIRLPDGRIVKVNKALYGLRRSPRLWYQELARYLASIGYHPIEADPCVFINSDGLIILAYVDDLIFITRTREEMAALKKQVFSKFKCHDLGPISHYLGIKICRDRRQGTMELSMEAYIDKLGADFKRTNAPRRFHPLDPKALKLPLRAKDDVAPAQLTTRYQSLIGKLLYPASQLRTDIAFAIGWLARAMSNPTELHYQYAIQVLDYLYSTKDLVMSFTAHSSTNVDVYSKATSFDLHAYSDASFADAEDRKSTSGYLFKFAGGTICHRSSKQKLVTTSTTEAEYVGLTYAAKEATWLARLLKQVGYNGNDVRPIKLYGDNQPSIQLVASEGHHERTKHVDIYYHYIKDQVKDGCIVLQHVGTKDMAADGLTKPLDEIAHRRFLQQVGLRRPYLTATR